MEVTPADDNSTVVTTYQENFGFWKGNSAVIVAQGSLEEDTFETWVTLSNGGAYPLEVFTENALPMVANKANRAAPTLEVFPNPSASTAQIQFFLAAPNDVQLSLHNGQGQIVKTIALPALSKGMHTFNLEIQDVAAGIYQLKLQAGETIVVQTVVVAD